MTLPELQPLLAGQHVTVEPVPRRILALKAWRRRLWRLRFARALRQPMLTGSRLADARRYLSVAHERAES